LAMVALGEAERAVAAFHRLLPFERAGTPEGAARYRVEPYVVAGDVYTASQHAGRGGWSWYTGSASWGWRVAVEGILGLVRRNGALAVDPVLPASWRGFSATLRGLGGTLSVEVEKPEGVAGRVVSLALDGEALPVGEPVPLPSDGGTHVLRV